MMSDASPVSDAGTVVAIGVGGGWGAGIVQRLEVLERTMGMLRQALVRDFNACPRCMRLATRGARFCGNCGCQLTPSRASAHLP